MFWYMGQRIKIQERDWDLYDSIMQQCWTWLRSVSLSYFEWPVGKRDTGEHMGKYQLHLLELSFSWYQATINSMDDRLVAFGFL